VLVGSARLQMALPLRYSGSVLLDELEDGGTLHAWTLSEIELHRLARFGIALGHLPVELVVAIPPVLQSVIRGLIRLIRCRSQAAREGRHGHYHAR